jgi:hypothetical protein
MLVPESLILVIPILLGVYLIARGRAQSRWAKFWQLLGSFFLAVPCGGLTYLFVGIGIARARNVGHFYSVPFGGYAVRDSALVSSLLAWTAGFFCVFALVIRKIYPSKAPSGRKLDG